jgi:hypothetical protein
VCYGSQGNIKGDKSEGKGGKVNMKTRKVVIVIEAKSDATLKQIHSCYHVNVQLGEKDVDIHKVSVQVVKEGT